MSRVLSIFFGGEPEVRQRRIRLTVRLVLLGVVIFVSFFTYANFRFWVMDHGLPSAVAVGSDFRFYYEAGRGDFDYAVNSEWDGKKVVFRYYYPRWTAVFFFWCKYLEYEQAYRAWTIFLTICFFILVWEACGYGYAGTVIAVAGIKFFSICIGTGNIIPFLALLVLNPVTCLLAACFKLWLLCFLPLHFLLALRKHSPRYSRHSIAVHWENVRLSFRCASLIIVPAAVFFLTYERFYRLMLAGLPAVTARTFVVMVMKNLWR